MCATEVGAYGGMTKFAFVEDYCEEKEE